MRVLLVHPPDNKLSIAPGRLEPLGLEVLAACIPDHEVEIIDLRVDTIRELDQRLSFFSPQVVGVSVNNTINVIESWSLLSHIREKHPKAVIAVGGHHPTMIPQDFHLPTVDFIFLGWAEKSFPAFLDCLDNGHDFSKIQGLAILENGKHVFRSENPFNLKASEIPFPRRDLVKKYLKSYRSDTFNPTGMVNTTRGCSNRCSFCSVWQSSGGQVIVRPAEDVFYEIASLPDRITHVFFADDNSFLSPENQQKLGEMLRDHGIKKKYSGYCRSDTIIRHPEVMALWKKVGLDNLCVGFEGTDDSTLVALNKKNEIRKNEEAAKILNKLGIPFRPHFLIDPTFEQADFDRIRNYVHRIRLDSPIFPILTPIPGTESFKEIREQIILDYNHFDYAHAVIATKLPLREFYKSWLNLYLSCYSIKLTLGRILKRYYGRFIGNTLMAEENHHINLRKLFMLKVVSIFLFHKLQKHFRMVEKMGK
jgi:hopanoid C-3 methylase